MWSNAMLNTQWQGLGDPDNPPFAVKSCSAVSVFPHKEGIFLWNRRLGSGAFA